MVWFAGNRDAYIGRLNPETGQVQRFDMPDAGAGDPHTLVFNSAGDIWFTVQGGGYVGKLTTSSGKVDLIKVPGERTRPYGIWLDSHDRPWVNLFGTNRIAMVDPATMTLKETTLPRAEARTRRIVVTPDDMVWYVDYAGGYLGRLDPKTGEVKEWPAPSAAQSRPYAMALDGEGRIWFVETGVQPNQFVGFDPKTERFLGATPIPSGGGAVRHMMFHAPTNTFWFGTDTENIARATIR
jgi:virginiamycin B lyase